MTLPDATRVEAALADVRRLEAELAEANKRLAAAYAEFKTACTGRPHKPVPVRIFDYQPSTEIETFFIR